MVSLVLLFFVIMVMFDIYITNSRSEVKQLYVIFGK